jgi:hypothetical protein
MAEAMAQIKENTRVQSTRVSVCCLSLTVVGGWTLGQRASNEPERNGHWLLKPQFNIDETRQLEDTLKFCRERAYKQRYPDDDVAASVEMVRNEVEDGLGEMVGKEEDEAEDAYQPDNTDDEPDYQPPAQKRRTLMKRRSKSHLFADVKSSCHCQSGHDHQPLTHRIHPVQVGPVA